MVTTQVLYKCINKTKYNNQVHNNKFTIYTTYVIGVWGTLMLCN